ncbi:MAG: hypothetical protein Kow0080_35790 [Candidatus Promineifilaceae bacterium]
MSESTITLDHSRRQVLQNQSLPTQKNANAGLWLDKFLVNQPKFAQNPQPGEDALTTKLVKEVCAIGEPEGYALFFNRWLASLEQLGVTPHKVKVNGRLTIGLGRASVIETGITLHHTYGVPVIPGSALKGLASSYAHQYLDNTIWAKGKPAHTTLFGTQERAGGVVFYDALPLPKEKGEQQWELEPDVITVHHPAYYRGEDKPPADWDSPNPVSFISVTGTFLVAIVPDSPNMQGWEEVAYGILRQALDELGVGAKTSSGYGRMRLDDQAVPRFEIGAMFRMKASSIEAGDVELELPDDLILGLPEKKDKEIYIYIPHNEVRNRQFKKGQGIDAVILNIVEDEYDIVVTCRPATKEERQKK